MLTIRLLGPPAIERDGRPVRSPRGRKAWAVLGYVLLAERAPSRKHLAEVFFCDADDPLGALRWTLAELRRTLLDGMQLESGLEFESWLVVERHRVSARVEAPGLTYRCARPSELMPFRSNPAPASAATTAVIAPCSDRTSAITSPSWLICGGTRPCSSACNRTIWPPTSVLGTVNWSERSKSTCHN